MKMKWQRLCLHAVDAKHQAQILGLVKKLLPSWSVKYRTKEKYFKDNDMYKCRIAEFALKGRPELRVRCAWGVLLVSDKLLNVADICFMFQFGNAQAVQSVEQLIAKVTASKLHFVLEEPILERRIDLLRGSYCLDELPEYDLDDARTALLCHVPWQLYGISRLWEQVLVTEGAQRGTWRQLRVKLRRMRSFLALLKPLLPRERTELWQARLKERADGLALVREYDVLLLICSRLRRPSASERKLLPQLAQQQPVGEQEAEDAVPQLRVLLEALRVSEQKKALRGLKLNTLTLELAQLLLFILSQGQRATGMSMEAFFGKRLRQWAEKLLLLPEKYPDVRNMEQLHKVRIKLRRFRYALQGVPELDVPQQLLRRLTFLQDLLGLLHDDYVNEQHLQALAEQNAGMPELRCEIALMRGWEQAKADAAMQQLSERSEEFEELLRSWLDE